MTLFTRKSMISHKEHSLEIDITENDWEIYKESGHFIQNSFPDLTAGEREFLLTGITQEEWDETFSEDGVGS